MFIKQFEVLQEAIDGPIFFSKMIKISDQGNYRNTKTYEKKLKRILKIW